MGKTRTRAIIMRMTSTILGIAALAALTGCSSNNGPQGVSHMEGKPAPDFELVALDGGKVRLSEFRGKPVLLAFFGYG